MTRDELADKGETSRGLFLTAHAYWESASALETSRLRSGHRQKPINYLYFHAIELFLKSFLLHKGVSHEGLKNIGHKQKKLAESAAGLGLNTDSIDYGILAHIDKKYIDARYLRTGPSQRIPSRELWKICSNLFDQVRDFLRDSDELHRSPANPLQPHEENASLTLEQVAALIIKDPHK